MGGNSQNKDRELGLGQGKQTSIKTINRGEEEKPALPRPAPLRYLPHLGEHAIPPSAKPAPETGSDL
jgi:hypothetical protein